LQKFPQAAALNRFKKDGSNFLRFHIAQEKTIGAMLHSQPDKIEIEHFRTSQNRQVVGMGNQRQQKLIWFWLSCGAKTDDYRIGVSVFGFLGERLFGVNRMNFEFGAKDSMITTAAAKVLGKQNDFRS
jgi:hypothetical protein